MEKFNQETCDWRHMAAVTADCNCANDCDMKCPYVKDEDKKPNDIKFDIVAIEREFVNSGINSSEIQQMFGLLKADEVLPFNFSTRKVESSAIGFLTIEAAEELNFEYEDLRMFLTNIMNDMNNEDPTGMYTFNGLTIFFSRNLPSIN